MDREKFHVDIPDEITVKKEIDIIVEKGMKPKESFCTYIKNMYKLIGVKYLFHDAIEIIFVILLFAFILSTLVINKELWSYQPKGSIYAFIVIVSPLLYLAISLLSFINTKQKGTYEIEMTCKYNLYQLAAFRMLVFSVLCILFNVALVGFISLMYAEISFLRALMISITSLFLFSTTFLYITLIMKSKITKFFVIGGWILINLFLCLSNIKSYINVLNTIPIYVYLVVTLLCIYGHIKRLKNIMSFRSIKGEI
ncbi:hypothetical protein [Desnuesiella massiliensis]|uniref:hypothetical protein n=1 Tax=Desnuesiella massiliensis TaxID=1650662 RepID=UPI0006E28278|nr:hypothetical protein [Desnuesiella massiliensis]